MTGGVTMRSSKGRTVLYVLIGCSVTFLVYVLSSTHNKLKSTEESNDKCQQQRDSLSAQLQVLYEHKSRLEKSLQNEMAERKKTENEMKTLKESMEREKMDTQGKYAALQQRYEEAKKSNQEDFNNLKGSYAAIVGDKEKLEADMGKYVSALEQQKSNEAKLQEHIKQLTLSQRTAEATIEQEKAKYNIAQNQLETCQAQLQLSAERVRSNIAVGANNQVPVIEKNVMKEQRDVMQPSLSNGIPVLPSSVAGANLLVDKVPHLVKEEVQSKDEKQAGDAVGPLEKEQQKPQASGGSKGIGGAGPQLPLSTTRSTDGRANEKPLPSLAAAKKVEQVPVAAVPLSGGAAIHSPTSSVEKMVDHNMLRQQVVGPQEPNGLAPNYQAAPPHDQAPPPPQPQREQQQQEAPQPSSLGQPDAYQPLNLQVGDQKKDNQQDLQGAIPAPQAADLVSDLKVKKEEAADNVLVPPRSAEAGDGGEAGPVDAGRANQIEDAPKIGNLARPLIEAPQHGVGRRGPVYPHVEEDNREYAEQAREDDAGDDQDPDGAIFGADHRKQFQDADFDDQMVEPENQQPANQMHGEGLMVNPK